MTKEEFIKKTIEDLPTRDLRYEMTDNEWYGWFEEVYDYALKQGQSLPIDSVSFSLRDEIAMNALNGLYASHANPQAGSPIHTDISKSAEHCYKIADAMIKARSNES